MAWARILIKAHGGENTQLWMFRYSNVALRYSTGLTNFAKDTLFNGFAIYFNRPFHIGSLGIPFPPS
jgi:hypothetical protein